MLHQHNSHREAAARIAWCINNKAIGVVTGEVGAGKTVALKGAVSSLDPARFTVIYQPNPEVGMRGLYDRIVTSLGGTSVPWNSLLIWGLGAVALLSTVAFIAAEARSAEPIFALRLFRNRTFAVSSAVGLIVGL